MVKRNEIYQAGEQVRHRIFGVGAVIDYIFAEDPETEHNRVYVDFDYYGLKWLIAAPGYLCREETTPLDGNEQSGGAEEKPDACGESDGDSMIKITFVMEEDGGDRHSMGSHWQPFCDDPAEIISRLPEILGQALLQTGFGEQIKHSQIPSDWVTGCHLSWPLRTQGLTVTLAFHSDANKLMSVYPFYTLGSQVRAVLDRVLVWESGVEAQLTVLIGNTELTFFDTCFLINRHLYKSGGCLEFILIGIVYSAEPAQSWEIPLPRYAQLKQWLEHHKKDDDDPIEIPDTLSVGHAAMLFPISGWDRDDYQFRGPVKAVRPVADMLGQSGWLLDVTVLRDVEEGIDDFDLRLLVTERAWTVEEAPKVGQDICGTFWLQGYLWSNYPS